jgi:hypothetical protein
LKFSSIPEDHFSAVIDRCYWPILDLVDDFGIEVGLEFPSSTLKTIHSIDPTLTDKVMNLAMKGKVEILASGAIQSLFPLIPKDVNEKNMAIGLDGYRSILNVTPTTGYVNEQAYSNGLPSIYAKYGMKNLVTMWEWLTKFASEPLDDYSPQIITGSDGTRINAIMNSYIAFQKFQRYIAGEYDIDTYMRYALRNLKEGSAACFPFYGSDWEIFGYNNAILGSEQTGSELERFRKFLEAAEANDDLSFITPSKTVELFPPQKEIVVDSPEAAIYSKKQEKFIVTRWAVCGRDNSFSNTMCYSFYKKLRRLNRLSPMLDQHNDVTLMEDLIDCWASDYRTHTTETKFTKFKLALGKLADGINVYERHVARKILSSFPSKVVIVNAEDTDWNGIPLEFKVHFLPHMYSIHLDLFVDGKKVKHQLEEIELYKDGSLRAATIVITPHIGKRSISTVEFVNKKSPSAEDIQVNSAIDNTLKSVTTPSTNVSFLRNRGATIDKLVFRDISKDPIVGWLEHGFYNDTRLSADFYTGHMISFDRDNVKTTDLSKVSSMFTFNHEHSIRVPVRAIINLPIGTLVKTYNVYLNESRIDLNYDFHLKEYRPSSFRLGIITLNPTAFDKSELEFSTTNGGDIERFSVYGSNIAYDEAVEPRVTSHGCLGATEEWIDIGDASRGITLFSDKAVCYSVPLLNYRETKDSFFYRIYNSISEMDDTTMTWWKGQKQVQYSILGRKGSTKKNVEICKKMGAGLLVLSDNPSIQVVNPT